MTIWDKGASINSEFVIPVMNYIKVNRCYRITPP